MTVEAKPFAPPQETSHKFEDLEVNVVQGLINGWDHESFRERDIRVYQINDVKKKLAKEFGGSILIGGFYLAIREMVKQDLLNLDELPSRLTAEPNGSELLIWASMYKGLNPWETRQSLGDFRPGKLTQLRSGLIRKLGFKNSCQAVAWWERERMKLGAQEPLDVI